MDNSIYKVDINSEEYIYNVIKELKNDNSKAKQYDFEKIQPKQSINEIKSKMESINSLLKSCYSQSLPTIEEYLDYSMKKFKTFKNIKFEVLFKMDYNNKANKSKKNLSKNLLDYSIQHKLVGFIAKTGKLHWDNEKINEFIESVSKSNRK